MRDHPDRRVPPTSGSPAGRPTGEQWPEADRLFRADPRWRGSDDAYSIHLGNGRTLWLFGDSFVAVPPAERSVAQSVWGNTIAIMEGTDPASASMSFYWQQTPSGPRTFFALPHDPGGPGRWVAWPGHGIRLDAGLLQFLMPVRIDIGEDDRPTGFEHVGWTAVMVDNPDDDPPEWRVRPLEAPQNPYGVVLGSAQVMFHDDHVYAYSSVPGRCAYLVRWPRAEAEAGDLSEPRWWCGGGGWVPQSRLEGEPEVVLAPAHTEFTVHVDETTGRFVQVQGTHELCALMLWRTAPQPQGPWSEPEVVFEPPECARSDVWIYAFKVHPHLDGGLVGTYVCNANSAGRLRDDESIYYPRFVRLPVRSPQATGHQVR